MKRIVLPALLFLPLLLPLGGCSCGFDCSGSGDTNGSSQAVLTLGFSDSLPEDLKEVVIEVDSITFRRTGAEDVVVTDFTIPELELVNSSSFKIDLLQYRGVNQLPVITNLQLTPALYDEVSIAILTGGINQSYALDANDAQKPIALATGVRGLPGMELESNAQQFTVEFGLAQALQYDATNDRYLLTTNGVRIENNQTAATLSGSIDSGLFDGEPPCAAKADPEKGNRVYLYRGSNLVADNLADVYTIDSVTPIPGNAITPFAVASLMENTLTGNWEYAFGYVPPGSYTIAFSCNTAADDAVEFNDLAIPLPTNQTYQITLSEAQRGVCNLDEAGGC